jgi:hypothetical protein
VELGKAAGHGIQERVEVVGAPAVQVQPAGGQLVGQAGHPALSTPLVSDDVLPDSTCTVHWAFFAVNTDPFRFVLWTAVFDVTVVDPVSTLLIVYPADRSFPW